MELYEWLTRTKIQHPQWPNKLSNSIQRWFHLRFLRWPNFLMEQSLPQLSLLSKTKHDKTNPKQQLHLWFSNVCRQSSDSRQ